MIEYIQLLYVVSIVVFKLTIGVILLGAVGFIGVLLVDEVTAKFPVLRVPLNVLLLSGIVVIIITSLAYLAGIRVNS